MYNLSLRDTVGAGIRVLCLGAHSDDIEIGCGGMILLLIQGSSKIEIDWVVFSAQAKREQEARRGAALFLKGARRKRISIEHFRDGFFPYQGAAIKQVFERLKRDTAPDLVLTHYRDDCHQDHRLLSELTWNTFRNHWILESRSRNSTGTSARQIVSCLWTLEPAPGRWSTCRRCSGASATRTGSQRRRSWDSCASEAWSAGRQAVTPRRFTLEKPSYRSSPIMDSAIQDNIAGPMEAQPPGNLHARCRFCGTILRHTFVDLGVSPLCESFLDQGQLNQMEPYYPLHVFVCGAVSWCSSRNTWSAKRYSASTPISRRTPTPGSNTRAGTRRTWSGDSDFDAGSRWWNSPATTVTCCAISSRAGSRCSASNPQPTWLRGDRERRCRPGSRSSAARVAEQSCAEHGHADLIVGNNVLAQVPDLNDFVAGMRLLLKPHGVITLEFPHVLRLIAENQFDTIYHEHFSYFSLITSESIFAAHDLVVFDVEELPTHGGSLRHLRPSSRGRVEACDGVGSRPCAPARSSERFNRIESYAGSPTQVKQTKWKLLDFLIDIKRQGKSVVGYGAPGQGQYTPELLRHSHGLPRLHGGQESLQARKVHCPGLTSRSSRRRRFCETRPDYVLILPWNVKDEIVRQMAAVKEWGGKFVVPIPEVSVIA